MKILYLAELKPTEKNGGGLCERRNLRILSRLCEVETVGVFAEGRSFLCKAKDVLFSPVPTLYTARQVREIKDKIRNSDAEIVFIETSRMGYFAKYAKKLGKKTMTFMHNCERVLFSESRGKIFVPFIKKQEALTLRYADFVFYLNERDREAFKKYYPYSTNVPYAYASITFDDRVTEKDEEDMRALKKSGKGIFLGSNFPPNYNGLKWFVENVCGRLDCKIEIVGKGFDDCTEFARDNVCVIGTVDDVSEYLKNADFVVYPIFEGSGMKVKTCEALMFGKRIFATDEALIGYEGNEKAYYRCNNEEEFAAAINSFEKSDDGIFSDEARAFFRERFTDDQCLATFERALEKIKEM